MTDMNDRQNPNYETRLKAAQAAIAKLRAEIDAEIAACGKEVVSEATWSKNRKRFDRIESRSFRQ